MARIHSTNGRYDIDPIDAPSTLQVRGSTGASLNSLEHIEKRAREAMVEKPFSKYTSSEVLRLARVANEDVARLVHEVRRLREAVRDGRQDA